MRSTAVAVSLLALIASALPLPADAQTKLKFAHPYPTGHYLWEYGGKVFVEEVEKESRGAVTFEIYPAQQLGKGPDHLRLVSTNTAQMAIVAPSYLPDKLPLSAVSELPLLNDGSCEGTYRMAAVSQPGGPLDKAEFAPNKIRVLFVATLPPFSIMTTKKQVQSEADLQGLKIRANGGAMDKSIRVLGGVPIRVTSMETYDAATRGTLDGALFGYTALPQYDLQGVFKYAVAGVSAGAPSVLYSINAQTWNKLPENIKQIMTKAAANAQRSMCSYMDKSEAQMREKISKENGLRVFQPSAGQMGDWTKKLSVVADEWVAEMKAAGRDGAGVLKAYKEAKVPQ